MSRMIRGDSFEAWQLAYHRGQEAAARGTLRIDCPMVERGLRDQWMQGYDSVCPPEPNPVPPITLHRSQKRR